VAENESYMKGEQMGKRHDLLPYFVFFGVQGCAAKGLEISRGEEENGMLLRE